MMESQIATMINSLHHVGIPVSNISVSEAFYNRLGFNNVIQLTFMMDGEAGTCIIMKNKKIIIELYQMPDKQLQKIRARKNGHINHIAFD